MFTDELRRSVWQQIRQRDLRQFDKLLTPQRLREAANQAAVAWGAGALNLSTLVWLSLVSAIHTAENFTGVLCFTLKLLEDFAVSRPGTLPASGRSRKRQKGRGQNRAAHRRRSKHDPHGSEPGRISEEAFVQARQRMPARYWIALILVLGRIFEQEHRELLHWRGFRLLALDGTCITLPGWSALRRHFGTPSNQGRAGVPQARMVMLQSPLVRLPLRYELTPLNEGERTVAQRLLAHLRPDDLVLMDRGFFSYGIFWQIQQQRAYFAVRRMCTTKLKTLKRLGQRDRLVRWTPADRQWKAQGLPASIKLRLIDYQIKGFRPSAIVTNVLDPRQISRDDWVRLSTQSDAGKKLGPGLYHRRWEIETTFCELKVHQKMEGSLRSRRPEGIAYEIAGHVLLYLLVRWLMVEAALTRGLDPLRLSFMNACRELLAMEPALLVASARRVRDELLPRLFDRIVSHQVPWRPGRHDPRPGDTRLKYVGKGKYRLPSKLAPAET